MLDHVLSRVAKDQTFYGSKAKQGAAEGIMTRAETKVHKNNKIRSSHDVFKWAALHTIIVKVSLYLVIVNTSLYKLY